MANEEHLALLQQGVDVWNAWRFQNDDAKLDLSGVNFEKSDLRGIDLSGTDLSAANLSAANLRDADLSGADLTAARLVGSDLSEAGLLNANLEAADLSGAILNGANLILACLNRANLSGANLAEAYLIQSDLVHANLNRADLRGADLREAILIQAQLNKANLDSAFLVEADLSEATLIDANLRDANLTKASLMRASLDSAELNGAVLRETNLYKSTLRETKLRWVNFYKADLSGADLSGADLHKAYFLKACLLKACLEKTNLTRAQVLDADLADVRLTGACLEDWTINRTTGLDGVICDYVYLKADQQERRPINGIFSPGEFVVLFQKALETVDLIFADGIDWKAFFLSFQELQAKYGDENLAIQAIEKKSGGAFVIRLEVPPEVDKAVIESVAKERYEVKIEGLEARYREELQAKNEQIAIYRQQSADLMEIVKLQASRPINVKAKAVAENQSKEGNYDLSQAKFGGGFATGGGLQIGGTLNDFSQSQDLTEAATEIHQLLGQLSQIYPTSTTAEQMLVATKAMEEIEKYPALKQRVVGALKSGGKEAFKELIDNPVINILLAALEGWKSME